jgi:hypothetical protein
MDHDSVNGITIPTPKMAGTFPRFLDLPKEIRLLIWELTYPRNRVIQVISTRFYKEFENWQLDAKGSHWTISSTSSIALDVCKESRDLAKTRYIPILECLHKEAKDVDLSAHPVRFSGLRSVRINLEHDTILMGPAHMTYISQHLDFSKIKHLALMSYEEYLGTAPVLSGSLRHKPRWTGPAGSWTSTWPNLKSLNFVLGRTSCIPDSENRPWQPGFELLDVDSNFSDTAAWIKQMSSKDETTVRLRFTTLQNICSLATELRRHYRDAKAAIEKAEKWENLEFRVTVAAHQQNMEDHSRRCCLRRDCPNRVWIVSYLSASSERNHVPPPADPLQWTQLGLFYWQDDVPICDGDGEMWSRYNGIQGLFEN